MYNDKNLTCADCGQEFVFTASEQDFYAQRGFTEPRRCPSCRASRKAARNAEGGGSSYGGYGAGGGYSAGGSSYGGERRLRLPRSRPARDVHRDLLVVRQGGPGPVPPDQRQARLLQRLLPHPARRLTTHPSRCGPTHGPPNQRRSPTRVVSRPGSFDSRARSAGIVGRESTNRCPGLESGSATRLARAGSVARQSTSRAVDARLANVLGRSGSRFVAYRATAERH